MCEVFQVCGESSTKRMGSLPRYQDCQAARNDRGWTPLTAAVLGCLSVSVPHAICWTPCDATMHMHARFWNNHDYVECLVRLGPLKRLHVAAVASVRCSELW